MDFSRILYLTFTSAVYQAFIIPWALRLLMFCVFWGLATSSNQTISFQYCCQKSFRLLHKAPSYLFVWKVMAHKLKMPVASVVLWFHSLLMKDEYVIAVITLSIDTAKPHFILQSPALNDLQEDVLIFLHGNWSCVSCHLDQGSAARCRNQDYL